MASAVLENLVKQLQKLPGIGPRSAERIAFHLLRENPEDAYQLTDAIRDLKTKLRHCGVCFNLTDVDPCNICQNQKRDHSLVCVVEQPRDLETIESTGAFNGIYHVLLGHLAPMEGVGPEHLTISALVERARKGGITEVIMATNPTLEGDGTSLHIADLLSELGVKVTRLARGVAVGSQLEYTSKATLADAIEERKSL
ncbi:MAG: recombination mediator RecR [Phycisphaerae bacterium]